MLKFTITHQLKFLSQSMIQHLVGVEGNHNNEIHIKVLVYGCGLGEVKKALQLVWVEIKE